jgi:hypothetical protein
MPCRDYMDDAHSGVRSVVVDLKARCDMLSRIACAALTHIEEREDGLEVLVLKYPEIQEWWTAHKEADRKVREEEARRRAAEEEARRLEKVKKETLAILTPDQIKALGLEK